MRNLHDISRARRQAGFTLMEILITLVVFSISIVGLVAIQSRSIEAEKAANQIRDAERIATEVMGELMATGFDHLVLFDFTGAVNNALTYNDFGVPGANRLRDFRRPPSDELNNVSYLGSVRNSYIVSRRVTFVCAQNPANPCIVGAPGTVQALNLEVRVQWIDDTNPTYPPPANLNIANVLHAWSEPTDPAFEPFIGHVELYTTRFNDGIPPPGP